MRYKVAMAMVLVGLVILIAWISVFLWSNAVGAVYQQDHVTSASPSTSALSRATSTAIPQAFSNNDNAAIPGALIGAVGAVLAAIIAAAAAFGVSIYQARHNSQVNDTRKGLNRTKTIKRNVLTYRDLLRTDPRIRNLQILDMSRPMEVTNVYVHLRLHLETRLSYELDPDLRSSEARRDPNALLQVGWINLESRFGKALDPYKAIRIYKHCIILGDPGAGKSTLLKYLALASVSRKITNLPDLPIHIELNAFALSGCQDLLDFASTMWDERYGIPKNKARKYMEENLELGKALLLLDALDETIIGATTDEAEGSYRRVADSITQIVTLYHRSHIVITARKAGYHQRAPLPGFTELEVLDFRLQDIQQFVYKWFVSYSDTHKLANAFDLITRLEHNPRIQALAANPLLLSLILIVYEAQLDLPDRRAELYKQCVETLLTKWDTSRDIRRRREFKPEHKRQLLEEVAWHFHLQGRRYFPENELLMVIANFLPAIGLKEEQSRQILEEIAAENGLLKEQAKEWFGFLHLTLQEYFVALYVADQNMLDILLSHRGEPWWEEVMLLYAGHTSDASPLLQKLLGLGNEIPLQEDIFLTNLILAGRCLGARPTIRQTTLREEVTSRLFDFLMMTPYSLSGQQIVDTLFEIGVNKVSMQLLRLISNQQISTKLSQVIAAKLGKSEERSMVSELVPLLSNQQIDSTVRQSIAQALGEFSECSVVPELLKLLADPQLELVLQKSYFDVIGNIDERPGGTEIRLELFKWLTNQEERMDLAKKLGKLSDRSIVPDLLQLLSNSQLHMNVRKNIASTLVKLGERSVVPELLKLLLDSRLDLNVREVAISTLGQFVDDEATARTLAAFLQQSDIADYIHQALWTISRRVGLRIFVLNEPIGKKLEIVKWENEPKQIGNV